jgi:iron complex outermembrane recepter protein
VEISSADFFDARELTRQMNGMRGSNLGRTLAKFGILFHIALVTALGLISSPAVYASDADSTLDNSELPEMLVTARRREENSQDVPLAISVLSAASLNSTGTLNVGDLTQLAPAVQFYSSNPRNSAITIRGLGSPFGLTNDGIEPGVGVYVDQVYYARPAASTFDFIDIDQLEILRGPQGTLYGKNTSAGAVSITSKKPSFTPEIEAEVTGGNYDLIQGKGSVSGPLIADTVAGRLGISYTHRDGTIYDVTTGQNINEEYNVGLRGQILWNISGTLSASLYADYSYQNPLGFGQAYVRTGSTQRPLSRQYAALAAASGYAPPSLNPFDRIADLDAELRARQRYGGTSAVVDWKIGPGTLTSVTAWRYWGWDPANDRDFTGLPITTISQNPSIEHQFSQELRYSGSVDRLDYVLGLYGFRENVNTAGLQAQGPLASLWLLSGANQNDPSILDGLQSRNTVRLRDTSAAVFSQLSWHLTPSLQLQPGLRINYDDKSGYYNAAVKNATNTALTSAQLGVLAPQNYTAHFSNTNLSGNFTVSYALTPHVLSYLTYARSFKPGGINLNGLPLDAQNRPITSVETVSPEKVNDYEVGLKSQFLDNRVTANVDAFWTDIHDYQATVTNSQANVIRGYLANAEAVRVRGVELDLAVRPIEALRLYINGAFTDARYVNFKDAPCPPELSGGAAPSPGNPPSAAGTPGGVSPSACETSGQWLPGVSRWAASYGTEYERPGRLFAHEARIYAAFDGSYRSTFSSNPSRSLYTDVSGYGLANFRAGVRTSERWDIYAWVRNAFDKNYFEFLATQTGNTGLIVGQPGDPRTYGVTVRATF